jgi:hypothetical protein
MTLNSNGLRVGRIGFLVSLFCLCVPFGLYADSDKKSVQLEGDFRYLIERIYLSHDDATARTRHRIRARFGIVARVSEEARIVMQLASGSNDLVSSNQTLSESFSSKNVVLDLAYGEYQPFVLDRRVTLVLGKSDLRFFRPGSTELLWDSDLRPEGLSSISSLGSEKVDLRLLKGYYILEERANDENTYLYAGQLVATIRTFPLLTSLKAGIGYFHFSDVQNRGAFYNSEFYGNSFYLDTIPASDPQLVIRRHQHEYRELELFLESGFSWNDIPILTVADYVVNTDAMKLPSQILLHVALISILQETSNLMIY